ncbi:MAG: hypothetical protein ABWY45_15025 [Mycobacterium sp.]
MASALDVRSDEHKVVHAAMAMAMAMVIVGGGFSVPDRLFGIYLQARLDSSGRKNRATAPLGSRTG